MIDQSKMLVLLLRKKCRNSGRIRQRNTL